MALFVFREVMAKTYLAAADSVAISILIIVYELINPIVFRLPMLKRMLPLPMHKQMHLNGDQRVN